MGRAARAKKQQEPALLKLDFGCGPHPREGFEGADIIDFAGKVKHVVDLRQPWPWADESVAEGHTSHFIEHLSSVERVHFFNELYRVLVPGGQCQIIIPHWSNCRAYGDPTHQWPPMGEFWFYYLDRQWRMEHAPHTDKQHWPQGYDCYFNTGWGYTLRPELIVRNEEFQRFAVENHKDAVYDLIATVTKK